MRHIEARTDPLSSDASRTPFCGCLQRPVDTLHQPPHIASSPRPLQFAGTSRQSHGVKPHPHTSRSLSTSLSKNRGNQPLKRRCPSAAIQRHQSRRRRYGDTHGRGLLSGPGLDRNCRRRAAQHSTAQHSTAQHSVPHNGWPRPSEAWRGKTAEMENALHNTAQRQRKRHKAG